MEPALGHKDVGEPVNEGRGHADRDSEGGESGARGGGGWGLWIGMAFDSVDFSFHRRDEVRGVLRSLLEGSWVILRPLKGWTWTWVPLLLWGSPTLSQIFFFPQESKAHPK